MGAIHLLFAICVFKTSRHALTHLSNFNSFTLPLLTALQGLVQKQDSNLVCDSNSNDSTKNEPNHGIQSLKQGAKPTEKNVYEEHVQKSSDDFQPSKYIFIESKIFSPCSL